MCMDSLSEDSHESAVLTSLPGLRVPLVFLRSQLEYAADCIRGRPDGAIIFQESKHDLPLWVLDTSKSIYVLDKCVSSILSASS